MQTYSYGPTEVEMKKLVGEVKVADWKECE